MSRRDTLLPITEIFLIHRHPPLNHLKSLRSGLVASEMCKYSIQLAQSPIVVVDSYKIHG